MPGTTSPVNLRPMILYLKDNGFQVSRDMPEKDIVEMYGLVVDQIQATRQRLLNGQADCFGDYVEELSAGCRTSEYDCRLINSCKRMTALQQVAKKLESKQAVQTPAVGDYVADTGTVSAEPPTSGKSADTYGFSKTSKMGRIMAIIEKEPQLTWGQWVAKTAHKLRTTQDEAKAEISRTKYELKQRGISLDVGPNDAVTITR